MPTVSGRFKTYREFAGASLTEIYGERLAKAYLVTVDHLESGVWINEMPAAGGIGFRWQPLPWDAQLSPVNTIASGDFDGDGRTELVLAQNHFTNQAETGLWRGNPGCHLEWAEGGFETVRHTLSGIFMPNDTKSIISLDCDGDGRLDILAGQNDDKLLLFHNTAEDR